MLPRASAAADARDVEDDDAPRTAQPTPEVLPTRARRRWSRADARLPALLAGELLAGVLLGMAWQVASTVPPVRLPAPSVVASSGDAVVVVPVPVPVLDPPAAPPPPLRTVPRNPFAVQVG